MEKSHQTQPLFLDWNIIVLNSKSNLHYSKLRSMSSERAHQKSAQLNHGLTLIGAHDQNCLDRKLTKIEAPFSDWKTIVRNSKSNLIVQIEDQWVENLSSKLKVDRPIDEAGSDLWWNLDNEEKLSFSL